MAEIDEHIKKLHDKFFYGNITEKEKMELYNHFKDTVCADGKIHKDILNEFLYVSHPDYGKPDKNGRIKII